MSTYETIMILDDKAFEDHGDAFSRKVAAHVKTLGGNLLQRKSLGRKHFARPIAKHSAGVYWDFVFELDPDKVAVFEDKYRLNRAVLRMSVLIYQEPPKGAPRVLDDVSPDRDSRS